VEILQCLIDTLLKLQGKDLDSNEILQGLSQVVTQQSESGFLHGIADCVCVRESFKGTKAAKKKKDEVTVSLENPLILQIRKQSLRMLYLLLSPLKIHSNSALHPVGVRIRSCMELVSSLCNTLVLHLDAVRLRSQSLLEEEPEMTQNLLYGFECLSFLLRDNPEAVRNVNLNHALLLEQLTVCVQHKQLNFYALQLCSLLTITDYSLFLVLQDVSLIDQLLCSGESHMEKLLQLTVNQEITGGKILKDGKKDDKGKKGNLPVIPPSDESSPSDSMDLPKADPKRLSVVSLSLLNKFFIRVVQKRFCCLSSSQLDRLIALPIKYIMNETVWEMCRSSCAVPFEEPVDRLLEYSCWLLGLLCETSYESCVKVCSQDGVSTLQQLLLNSSKIFPLVCPVDQQFLEGKLLSLRKFIEKSLFALLLPKNIILCSEEVDSQKCRWLANCNHPLTKEMISGYGTNFFHWFLEMLSVADDFDLSFRSCRILSSIILSLNFSDRVAILQSINTDESLTAKCCSLLTVVGTELLANLRRSEPLVKESPVNTHSLDLGLFEGFYFLLCLVECVLPISVDDVKKFAEKSRLQLLCDVLRELKPIHSEIGSSENTVCLHDPHNYDWFLISVNKETSSEVYILQPFLIDIFALVVFSYSKYRIFQEDVAIPVEPGKTLPASVCSCEESVQNTIKTVSDQVMLMLLQHVLWNFVADTAAGDEMLTLELQNLLSPNVLIRDSALQFLVAVGKCGAIGIAGMLDSIASRGFDTDLWESSSLSGLLKTLLPPVDSENFKFAWKLPVFYDDVVSSSPESLRISSRSSIINNYMLWPFFCVAGSIYGVMADPSCSPKSTLLSLEAAQSLMCVSSLFEVVNQPVVVDVLCASFLSIGGGFALLGALGSFGCLSSVDKDRFLPFATYLLSRGQTRETFWRNYYLRSKEAAAGVDLKTGKPVVKKDEKKKENKEQKKDGKQAAAIIPEILYNTESSEEFNDPNHGPSHFQWKHLLNVIGNSLHIWSSTTSLLICCIQSSLSDLALLLLEQGISVNSCDSFGRSALMYSLILEEEMVTRKLLSYNNEILVNQVDHTGNPTVLYGLCSIRRNINQLKIDELLNCYCSEPCVYYDRPIRCYGNSNLLSLLLSSSENYLPAYKLDLFVKNDCGVSPILFCLGIGELQVDIGGYRFGIKHQAYYDESYCVKDFMVAQQSALTDHIVSAVTLLINSGADVNGCSVTGTYPIHVASAYGDLPLIQVLFQKGARPNVVDSFGRHSLHFLAAACPPNWKVFFHYLTDRCVNHPMENEKQFLSTSNASFQEKQTGELSSYIRKKLSAVYFPYAPISPSTKDLARGKRVTFIELLLFCRDFAHHMVPLDYCFIHEYLSYPQVGDGVGDCVLNDHRWFLEIIRYNNYYRNENFKFERISFILYTLLMIKNQEPFPLALNVLQTWFCNADNGVAEENGCFPDWLTQLLSIKISDNNDIKKAINSYNIQNSVNLLFYNLVHFSSSHLNDFSHIPLLSYNVNDISLKFPVTSQAVNTSPHVTLNVLQMLSILLKDGPSLVKRSMFEKGKSRERNIQYESIELQLIDIIVKLASYNQFYSFSELFFNSSPYLLSEFGGNVWTHVHLAILGNNLDFIDSLYTTSLKHKHEETIDFWRSYRCVHFISNIPGKYRLIDGHVCDFFVALYAQNDYFKNWSAELLNEYGSTQYDLHKTENEDNRPVEYLPLHEAARNQQLNLLKSLIQCRKVDLNRKDLRTGHTMMHILCIWFCDDSFSSEDVISSYFDLLCLERDRIDLTILSKCDFFSSLIEDCLSNQETQDPLPVACLGSPSSSMKFMNCVEYVVRRKNSFVVKKLIELRKNDVIETFVNSSNNLTDRHSLLYEMEEENYQLLLDLNLVEDGDAVTIQAKSDEVSAERNESEKEADDQLHFQKFHDLNTSASVPEFIDQGLLVEAVKGNRSDNENPEALQKTLMKERLLSKSNSMLRLILDLIQPLEVFDESYHFNKLYSKGNLIDVKL
jgi:ankyrin repeat protein